MKKNIIILLSLILLINCSGIKNNKDKIEGTIWTHNGDFFMLKFKNDTVFFFFTPQCCYFFPMKKDSNKIYILWDTIRDCIFNLELRTKLPKVKNPEKGDVFAEIIVISDTNLYIRYNYKNYFQKQNQLHSQYFDTLFPSEFFKIDSL